METKKSILDYISLSVLEIIFDNYCNEYVGICFGINDTEENIVITRNFHPICGNFHRKMQETEEICLECNKYISNYLKEHDYIEYKCGNGLVDIAIPLFAGNERIGNFYIGQIFIEGDETPLDFFEEHAEKYGFDKEEYLKSAKNIKVLSREQVNKLVEKIKEDIISLISL